MINALYIKNFKSFQDTKKIEIKPIMLLIGPNSSGKTSFIQFLLCIKQTLESRTKKNPILINGRYVELGTFKDLIFNHDESQKLEFNFYIRTRGFEEKINTILEKAEQRSTYFTSSFLYSIMADLDFKKSLSKSDELKEDSRKVDMAKQKELKEILSKEVKNEISEVSKIKAIMRNLNFNLLKLNVKISFEELEKKMVLSEYTVLDTKDRELLKVEDGKINLFSQNKPLKKIEFGVSNFFLGMDLRRPDTFHSEDLAIEILNLLNRTVVKSIEEFFEKMYYLGPLREYPKRYYLASGEVPYDVGFKGEFFVDVLYRTKLEKTREYEILDSLNKWMKKFNMAYEIKLEEIADNIYSLVIFDPFSKIPVTITDVGFGVSQVLPILVEGFHIEPGSTIIVEQPEIHLHPKVQAELGDLLIEFYEQGKFSIIETHSEHLILRIQRRIAEGIIKNSDVGIYYFEPTENGSKIIEMEIDESGMIKNWPKGFFEEDFVESYKHIEAIVEKSGNLSSL